MVKGPRNDGNAGNCKKDGSDGHGVGYREWCQMYLKAAKLAEAMQLAATPNQPSVRSASPEAVSHGEPPLQCMKLHVQPTPLHFLSATPTGSTPLQQILHQAPRHPVLYLPARITPQWVSFCRYQMFLKLRAAFGISGSRGIGLMAVDGRCPSADHSSTCICSELHSPSADAL